MSFAGRGTGASGRRLRRTLSLALLGMASVWLLLPGGAGAGSEKPVVAGGVVAGHALRADEIRRLEAGEILVSTREIRGRSVPFLRAYGLVDAPPADVWPIVDECRRYEETMPRTIESEEIERDGNRVRCRVRLDMPFPFSDLVAETDAVHTVDPGQRYEREWSHRSGDFEVNDGRWTLEPWGEGERTLAVYEAETEPRVPIPAFLLSLGTRVTLPGMIEALRKHVAAPPRGATE